MNPKLLSLCLALSLCLTLAVGCAQQNTAQTAPEAAGTAQSAETVPSPAPKTGEAAESAPASAPDQSAEPVSGSGSGAMPMSGRSFIVEHMDLSEGYPVDMYFELPVFLGTSDAMNKINAQLAQVRGEYINLHASDDLQMVIDSMNDPNGPTREQPYVNRHPASVQSYTDDIISVTFAYDWWMGGVADYGLEGYTFNAKTGEQLYLSDLLEGSDAEIKEAIAAALLEQYPDAAEAGIMETPAEAIRGKDIRDFHFYVLDNAVHIAFNKYDITYGAAGAFDVVLSNALKPLN